MRRRLQVLKAWFLDKENLTLIIAVSSACMVMFGVTLFFVLKPARYQGAEVDRPTQNQASTDPRHPLTGTLLEQPIMALPRVFGVMIENSADAWPLSGLEDAFLVIEAPVEGGIPRFVAFYSTENEVEKIGPVRSARPYYLDWNDELEAVYAHVGGSPEGLELIDEVGSLDLNEFWNGQYFWRDSRRGAPHNVYTSTALLTQSLEGMNVDQPVYEAWTFKHDAPLDLDPLSLIIDWGAGGLYDVTWEYQPENNTYLRKQDNATFAMQDGDTVTANNLVVMATQITVIDNVGRRRIKTTGEGDVLVVQDGRIILGTWKKPTRTDRLRFYDNDGQEINMNAGKTWIEVVPSIDRASTQTDL